MEKDKEKIEKKTERPAPDVKKEAPKPTTAAATQDKKVEPKSEPATKETEKPPEEPKKQETQGQQETKKVEEKKPEEVKADPKPEPAKKEATKPVEKEKVKTTPSFVLSDMSEFKEAIEAISNLIGEAKIRLNEKGLFMRSMDPANVAMADLSMSSTMFTEWKVTGQEEFAVNLVNLKAILRRAIGKCVLSIKFGDTIKITIMGKTCKKFTLPVIEDEGMPWKDAINLQPTAISTIDKGVFKEALEDVKLMSESIILSAKKNKLIISGKGDLSSANVNMLDEVSVAHKEDVKAKYSIDYLSKMICKFDKIKLSFGTDYPLSLKYANEAETMALIFTIAPRVEND